MKTYKRYFIGIPIILIFLLVLTMIVIRQNKNIPLKVNEINIDGKIIQLTTDEDTYSKYKNLDGFEIYEDNNRIDIQNPDIVTYKDIKVGDSADKLDFCYKVGTVYYYKTDYRYKEFDLKICYGVDPFDNTIISITYKYDSVVKRTLNNN